MLQRQQVNFTTANPNLYFSHKNQSVPQHFDTIIIGAGHSGLITGFLLNKPYLILEKKLSPGSSWHSLPDDFTLAMSIAEVDLPGLYFVGVPSSFLGSGYSATVTLHVGALDAKRIVRLIHQNECAVEEIKVISYTSRSHI